MATQSAKRAAQAILETLGTGNALNMPRYENIRADRFAEIIDREAHVEALVRLAQHVTAMETDAYLVGHPEWAEIVKDARAALKSVEGK